MFEAKGPEAPQMGQVSFDHHVLMRGPWSLWSAEEALPSMDEARAWFAGPGLRITGAIPMPVLRGLTKTLAQWPQAGAPWVVDWLWGKTSAAT